MLLTALLVVALSPAPTGAGSADPPPDRLLVSGRGGTFGVQVPDGWKSDTGILARSFDANLLLTPTEEETKHPVVSIRIRINGKTDEQIEKDLAADVAGYSEEYPDAVVRPLDVAHESYASVGSTVSERGVFSDYVLYVNPGKELQFILSVALSIRGREATTDEMNAFREVVRSLQVLPAK